MVLRVGIADIAILLNTHRASRSVLCPADSLNFEPSLNELLLEGETYLDRLVIPRRIGTQISAHPEAVRSNVQRCRARPRGAETERLIEREIFERD
jgi:hypothetical protein